jgi:hypothetical protein
MQKNKLKKLTSKTPRFVHEKLSGVKRKITEHNLVKSFTINNNELTGVFPRTISKYYYHIKNTHILGLKYKLITSIVNFNKNKEIFHQVEN